MEEFNKSVNLYQQVDFPSFDQTGANAHDDSSIGLMELSLNLRNHLNSLKSIKKNFSRRFDGLILSSEKKDYGREGINFEQKYEELKKKYDELQEVYNKHVNETIHELQKARQEYERRIKSLKDELEQKNNYIDLIKQGHLQAQEKNNALEARITSLEQLNSTLSLQLKEKSKELSGSIDNVGNNVISRSRDLVNMKSDFTRIVDRIGALEDIIKNLREAKKQDSEALEELTQKNEDLKAENFQILLENKKLKNEMEDFTTKFSSLDKSFIERKQKTEEFINSLIGYKQSFEIINQVQLDLDNVCEPLKDQNKRLLEEKEKLVEENRQLKLELKDSVTSKPTTMEVEEDEKQIADKKESVPRGIDESFYFEIMAKLKTFEKETENKDKEIHDLKSDLDELKTRNIELEAKVIGMNRSPSRRANNDQFLSVEPEAILENSPNMRRNASHVSQDPSEKKSTFENEEQKRSEKEISKQNQDAIEEEPVKDARLKIERKPKQIKKVTNAFNPFNAILICPNCGLIIKKGDKNTQDCSKCHTCVHEKCLGVKGKDALCNPCNKKFGKSTEDQIEQEDDGEQKDNSQ